MAACSQEAALERVSGVKIQQLCERKEGEKGKKGHPTAGKRPEANHVESEEMRKKHLQRKLFKKVKRLHNLGRHVCTSGGRNKCIDETMGGGGGEMESIHSSVCVSGV